MAKKPEGFEVKTKPTNQKLYNLVKKNANDVFDSPTGAFRSMWIVKEYKRLGGTYTTAQGSGETKKPEHSKLKQWRDEKWIDLNQPKKGGGYEKCGHKNIQNDKYPLCRPSEKVNESTPKTYQSIDKNKIEEVNKEKQIIKNKGNIKF